LIHCPGHDVKLPTPTHQFKLNAMPFFAFEPRAWKLFPAQSFATPKNYIKWNKLIKRCNSHITSSLLLLKKRASLLDSKSDTLEFAADTPEGISLLITDSIGKSIPPICIHENFIEALVNTEVKEMDKPHCAFDTFIFLFPLTYKTFSPWGKLNDPSQPAGLDKEFFVAFVRLTENIIDCTFISSNAFCSNTYRWSSNCTVKELKENKLKPDLLTIKRTMLYERLIKNAILVYTYDSKYVTEESIKPSAGKGFNVSDSENKPFSVRWLGKDFKKQQTKYIFTDQNNSNETGNRTVRPHWRKGHWHTVCSGAKRKEKQVRWFKPVFVNAD